MEGWNTYTLNDICPLITDGSHFSPKEAKDGNHRIATVKDMNEFGFDLQNCKRISNEDYSNLVRNGCKPEKNDILYSKDGTIGIIQLFKGDVDIVLLSSIAILRCDKSLVDPKFLSLLLRSPKIKQDVSDNYRTGSALPRIILKDFKKIEIDIPPLPLQNCIAEILGALDDKIELNRQMNHTLEQMVQALYKHYFVDDIDPENLPEGWKLSKICDFAKLLKENVNPLQNKKFIYSHYSIPAYDEGKTPKSELGSEIMSNKTVVKSDTILYSKLNPRFPRIWIITSAPENAVCSTEFLVLKPRSSFYSLLFSVLSSSGFIDEITPKATGTSGSHQRVKSSDILDYEVPIKDEIVKEFDEYASPLLRLIDENIKGLANLTKIRDTLLPKLISGEIIPSELQTFEQAL